MKYYVSLNDVQVKDPNNKNYQQYDLIGEKNGCTNKCRTGIGIHSTEEYGKPSVHDDQEGFFILEGTGWTKVGDQEFRLEPGMSYIVPVGVSHVSKKDKDSVDLKTFFFHAAGN